MSTPLADSTTAAAASSASPSVSTTPQQRLERVLAHLAPQEDETTEESNQTSAATQSDLAEPVQRINAVMRNYGVEFEIQEYDSRVITRIVDRESGDTIRQIPSEEVLRIARSLAEMQGRLIHLEA
ncbi:MULTISPECIES: flagellar protein FlaG [unclassified Modicisalibacter]|uniref:flagellar protein FlaG n=1 Tax=unclassified Modicisalibacter TaxID=2679913 RepID=UPI001CCA8856|nr:MULTISPECIES: flagellar protein FlaG [unclassified Modicisalibacter]MBZ9556973.1 flagellar protein FlaG [Modicisalibacter sp. R2A 31.J]MBZ9574313.1 flagellar protein FlaG [Modicisalibacter sp. MOD 31.J]